MYVDLSPLQASPTDLTIIAAAWDGTGSPSLPDGWNLFGTNGRASIIHRTGAPQSADITYNGSLTTYGFTAMRIEGSVSTASFPISWPSTDLWFMAHLSPGGGSTATIRTAKTLLPEEDPDYPDTPRPGLPADLDGGIVAARQGSYLAAAAAKADTTEVVKAQLGASSYVHSVILGAGGWGKHIRIEWSPDGGLTVRRLPDAVHTRLEGTLGATLSDQNWYVGITAKGGE